MSLISGKVQLIDGKREVMITLETNYICKTHFSRKFIEHSHTAVFRLLRETNYRAQVYYL